MSDYEEDFEDVDDAVAGDNEPSSPGRYAPTIGKKMTGPISSGGGADAKAASTAAATKGRKKSKNGMSSQLKTASLGSKVHLTPKKKAANSTFSKSPTGAVSPRDRIISSKVHAIKSLQNELADAKRELVELRKENKLLNRIQIRQEKDLAKLDSQEGELPQLLRQHNEEVRVLKSKLKKSREVAEGHREQYDMLVLEVHQLKDRNKKLEGMNKKKNLVERDRLTAELSDVKRALEERERRIVELEHSSERLSKNHLREAKLLQSKNASLQHALSILEDEHNRLRKQLREKEKEIEVKNIYTQRMPKSMPRLLPRLPTTCDAATMTDGPEPAAHRAHAPKSKPLSPSPAVPKRKVFKASLMQPAPLASTTPRSNLQQKETSPSHSNRGNASPKPDCKPEDPKPDSSDGPKEVPQSSTPHPSSSLRQAQPSEATGVHSRLSSNPHSTAVSSLAGTPATTSVGSTKESIAEGESDRREGLDLSSIHQTPGAVTQPVGVTTVMAGSTSTQHPQLAHDASKLPTQNVVSDDLAPSDGGMTKEDEERKNEQERKKAILLAKLQAIDESNGTESPNSHLPPASKQGGTEAHSTERPSSLEALSSQTPDFGRTSVLQQRLDKGPQATGGDASNNSAFQMQDSHASKGGKSEAVSDLFETDRTGTSNDSALPSQPQRTFPTQTIAQSTFDKSVATETQLAGVTLGNPLDKHPTTSSSGSLPQWPNTVHNMYLGRPALATAEDPFGTRLSGRSNRSNPRLREKGTPVHGAESADALSHYKPKFSRRAQQNVTKRHVDKGISLSDDSRTQLTTMTHTHRAKASKDGGSGPGTSSLSDMHQPWPGATSSKPLGAAFHNDQGYPWEMEVKLSSVSPGQSQPKANNGLRFGQVDSAKKVPGGSASLLPHRKTKPLQPAIGMSSMPGAVFDDDIEELSLT